MFQTKTSDFQRIDELIRQGEFSRARQMLLGINLKEVDSKYHAFIARLSWRLGVPQIGIRALSFRVREKYEQTTAEERAEYAACLNSIGGISEASQLLTDEREGNGWTELVRAFILISQWDYEAAENVLFRLFSQPMFQELPLYNQMVAKINYLASLIANEKWEKADSVFVSLKDLLRGDQYRRLYSNLKELHLQYLLGTKQYESVSEALGVVDAQRIQGPERFYLLKWMTYLDVLQGRAGPEKLLDLSLEAFKNNHWEVARDLEARVAVFFKNPIFLKRVLYATPWSAYRKRILERFGQAVDISHSFDYWLNPANEKYITGDRYRLSVISGDMGEGTFKKGLSHFRLIRSLASDLYRPHRIGSLFNSLFPDEYYNPLVSPNRIHQAIRGARSIIADSNLPLKISEINGAYRLDPLEPLIVELPYVQMSGKADLSLEPLHKLGERKFDVQTAAEILAISQKSAQRLLARAVSEGKLFREGAGRGTRYYFKPGGMGQVA